MNTCPRLDGVHPDATHPELYEARTPRECREHIMRNMGNNRANFGEYMDRMNDAKKALDMRIKGIKSITDESREEADKAFKEFENSMESLKNPENNGCKPPSLYLPEFEKEFTDEPCPYTEIGGEKMPKDKQDKPNIEETGIKETSVKTTELEGTAFSAVITEGDLINIKHSSREGNDRLLIYKDQIPEFEKIFAKAKKCL